MFVRLIEVIHCSLVTFAITATSKQLTRVSKYSIYILALYNSLLSHAPQFQGATWAREPA